MLINDHWVFPRRTESGSNVSMNVEEIRGKFLDAGRRQNELAWLRAEVERIRDIAERVNREASSGVMNDLDLMLTRFDVSQLKALLLSVFSFIGRNRPMVECLHSLIERCMKVDTVLAPMVAFTTLPRDRSYSRSRHDWRAIVVEDVPQIVITARLVLRFMEELSPSDR